MLFLPVGGGSRWGYPLFSPGLFVNTPSQNFSILRISFDSGLVVGVIVFR